MNKQNTAEKMPPHVAAIAACGYAIWATEDVDTELRERFQKLLERVDIIRGRL